MFTNMGTFREPFNALGILVFPCKDCIESSKRQVFLPVIREKNEEFSWECTILGQYF